MCSIEKNINFLSYCEILSLTKRLARFTTVMTLLRRQLTQHCDPVRVIFRNDKYILLISYEIITFLSFSIIIISNNYNRLLI